jgi:uncharacterized membrane protein
MTPAAITFYSLVLFVHIAAVVIAFGVLFAYPVLLGAARRGAFADVEWFHRAQLQLNQRVIAPAGAVVLAAGLYLAVEGPYDFGDPWIGTTLLILVVVMGLAGAFFAPRERQLAALAEGGGERGAEYEKVLGQLRRGVLVADALVLVAIFLMVTKPGA